LSAPVSVLILPVPALPAPSQCTLACFSGMDTSYRQAYRLPPLTSALVSGGINVPCALSC
jgi:hypothetical protein